MALENRPKREQSAAMLPARLAITFMLALSLPISGSVWAQGPLPDNLDNVNYAGIEGGSGSDRDASPEGPARAGDDSNGDCDHHDDGPTVPAVNDGGKAPSRQAPGNPHGCCADGNCPCPPPIGKGMAIGPAHLASNRSATPYPPVAVPVSTDPYGAALRPPIF
ncbi:hypothetical protein B1808_06350 [Pseudofulvimonas gallinarii]|jgi:hypothetical protein|nr:hypothetical protein B1808_06350 [Pseudofulvimonas gallinarii]